MLEPHHWLKTLGALGIGGAIGGALGVPMFLLLRRYLDGLSLYQVMALFAAIGTGTQQGLQRTVWFLAFFERLYELGTLKKRGIIKDKKYQEVVDKLVDRRFLGE